MAMSAKHEIWQGRRPPGSFSAQDRGKILDYLKELAAKLGKETLTTREVNADGHIHTSTIIRAFGGFSEALIQAGLKPGRIYKRNPEVMLEQLATLVKNLGRYPSKTEINNNLSYHAEHYEKEFGSISKAVERVLERGLSADIVQPVGPALPLNISLNRTRSRRKYGPFIDFRGLRHAPINELGVVFLFGMLANELGFVVEGIQSGFPDCDAKLRRPDGSFERVRIEFEYKSSSFARDRHDPKECDLIVCWEHDWTDCPIEVLELSKVVRELSSQAC